RHGTGTGRQPGRSQSPHAGGGSRRGGAIKQKYANRHRAYQYIAESKRWESNDRQKVRFCYRFNLTKGTDIATTFSIVKPTLQVFSSNLSPLVRLWRFAYLCLIRPND